MRDVAFASAISQKIRQEEVVIVDKFNFKDSKTKACVEFLNKFGINKRVILITDGKDESVMRATNNIQKVSCENVDLINVGDIVENTYVVITKNAIKKIEEAYI